MKEVDYLIVSAGLYGSVFTHEMKNAGYSYLVIDKRPHLAGNIFTELIEGIHVHKYGTHIFHTDNKVVWDFVNQLTTFNRYTNSPVVNYHGKLNDERNSTHFAQYMEKAKVCFHVLFGGILGKYRYIDMDDVIGSALQDARLELNRRNLND